MRIQHVCTLGYLGIVVFSKSLRDPFDWSSGEQLSGEESSYSWDDYEVSGGEDPENILEEENEGSDAENGGLYRSEGSDEEESEAEYIRPMPDHHGRERTEEEHRDESHDDEEPEDEYIRPMPQHHNDHNQDERHDEEGPEAEYVRPMREHHEEQDDPGDESGEGPEAEYVRPMPGNQENSDNEGPANQDQSYQEEERGDEQFDSQNEDNVPESGFNREHPELELEPEEGSGSENEENVHEAGFHRRESSARRRSSDCHRPRCSVHVLPVDICRFRPARNGTAHFVSIGDFVANDGRAYYDHDCNVFMINSKPFIHWVPPSQLEFLDHLKAMVIGNERYDVPVNGSVTFQYKVEAKVSGLDWAPFPRNTIEENDVRLASAAVGVVDQELALSFGFQITNDRVYAVYQRMPTLRPLIGNYAAFVTMIPLALRSCNQVMNLRIRLDSRKKFVTWLIDDCEKYMIRDAGFPAERRLLVSDFAGEPELVWPKGVQLVMGTESLLDYYPAAKDPICRNNHKPDCMCGFPDIRIGLVNNSDGSAPQLYDPLSYGQTPAAYYDHSGTEENMHIWGQGVKMNIHEINIETKTCRRREP